MLPAVSLDLYRSDIALKPCDDVFLFFCLKLYSVSTFEKLSIIRQKKTEPLTTRTREPEPVDTGAIY